jgi:hypothetical protein
MSDRTLDWESVEVRCWNHRKDSSGTTAYVTIGKDRYCHSDCDCEQCPINQFHKLASDKSKPTEEP